MTLSKASILGPREGVSTQYLDTTTLTQSPYSAGEGGYPLPISHPTRRLRRLAVGARGASVFERARNTEDGSRHALDPIDCPVNAAPK